MIIFAFIGGILVGGIFVKAVMEERTPNCTPSRETHYYYTVQTNDDLIAERGKRIPYPTEVGYDKILREE